MSDNYGGYPPTPHPEDGDGYWSQNNQSGYGQGAYGQGAYGQGTYGQYSQGATGPTDINNPQTINVMNAVSWAWSGMFRQKKPWLFFGLIVAGITFILMLITLAFGLMVAATQSGSMSSGTTDVGQSVGNAGGSIISAVATLFGLNAAFRYIDQGRIDWSDFTKDIRFWPALGAEILAGIVVGVILLVIGGVLFGIGFGAAQIATWLAVLVGIIGGLIFIVISLILSALIVFVSSGVIDHRDGIIESIQRSINIGRKNMGKLIVYSIILGFVGGLFIAITLGLGMILFVPFSVLATAHMFRQAVGLPGPQNA